MRTRLVLGVLIAAAPAALPAQDATLVTAIVEAQPYTYSTPECGIKGGHYRVNSAATYLKTAITNEANRERLLNDATRAILDAMRENQQGENPAAWYYLARVALYQGDVVGADTAFARAEALAPQCADEIRGYRERTGQALLQAGSVAMETDKARASRAFQMAARINPKDARTWYVVGGAIEAAGQADSALPYYKKAWEVAPDPADQYGKLALNRVAGLYDAAGNVDSAVAYYMIVVDRVTTDPDAQGRAALAAGRALYGAQRYPEAITVFRRQLKANPDDADTKRFLAITFDASNQPDSAQAYRVQVGMGSGVSASDTTGAVFLINRGAQRYRAGEKEAAAADFQKALAREPGNRTALRNLLSTWNDLKNGQGLVETSAALLEREPLNEMARRYQIQGYIYLNDREAGGKAVDALDAMPVTVDDVKMTSTGGGVSLAGVINGRDAKRQDKTAIPAAPLPLVFEFLNASGEVVATQTVTVPALQAGAIHQLSVTAAGAGISDWRYRTGS